MPRRRSGPSIDVAIAARSRTNRSRASGSVVLVLAVVGVGEGLAPSPRWRMKLGAPRPVEAALGRVLGLALLALFALFAGRFLERAAGGACVVVCVRRGGVVGEDCGFSCFFVVLVVAVRSALEEADSMKLAFTYRPLLEGGGMA